MQTIIIEDNEKGLLKKIKRAARKDRKKLTRNEFNGVCRCLSNIEIIQIDKESDKIQHLDNPPSCERCGKLKLLGFVSVQVV